MQLQWNESQRQTWKNFSDNCALWRVIAIRYTFLTNVRSCGYNGLPPPFGHLLLKTPRIIEPFVSVLKSRWCVLHLKRLQQWSCLGAKVARVTALKKNEQHSVMRMSCKKWLPLSETLYFQEFNEARFCHQLSAAVHVAQSCTSNKETQKSYRAFQIILQHNVKFPCIDEEKRAKWAFWSFNPSQFKSWWRLC